MKLGRGIILLVVLAVVTGTLAFLLRDSAAKKSAEQARQEVRREGFKTDLAEFDFSTSPELRRREHALTNADGHMLTPDRWRLQQNELQLMQMISADAAGVVWRRERLPDHEGADLWPAIREIFAEDRTTLDAACEAALSGPIRFEMNARHGLRMLLPYLPAMKHLAVRWGQRTMLELHDGNVATAWTNLLAATRLITAWEVEPAEVSHLVRFVCAELVFNTTWQILQTNAWTDEQLRQLQQEWESVDYFKGLPETIAFMRAGSVAATFEPVFGGMSFKEILRHPNYAWGAAKSYWDTRDYRLRGVYEDKKALLLHFRDREVEVRNAIRSPTWLEMRTLPGVTNLVPFQSTQQSRVAVMLNMRQMTLGFQRQGTGFLGRAAESEARRRLIITALALERYHLRYGDYPGGLAKLAPEFLKSSPTDFIDGQPLRYRLSEDGHYVLWSVGLDGVDHGGKVVRQRTPRPVSPPGQDWQPQRRQESDLIWPRPASAVEVEDFYRQQIVAQREQLEQSEARAAEWHWEVTAARQAQVEKILQSAAPQQPGNPMVQGRALNELLRNPSATGTNLVSMAAMLTLKQVLTGAEPETATFELPIAYDVLTNLGALQLYIDPLNDESADFGDEGCHVAWLECRRATNGNCLLIWDTIYEAPGRHALQAGLSLENGFDLDISGPFLPFVVSNLCQFSVESAVFNPAIGATLRAKLPEANARYSVEINSPAGEHLKTITGNTTNGVIKVFWDLVSEQGVRCTNQSFGTVFHVTLTDSGRSQTLRGP